MADNNPKWYADFNFVGRNYRLECKRLDGTNLDAVKGEDERRNYWLARAMLTQRVVEKIYEDGRPLKKWRLAQDGSGGLPIRFDPDTRETLGDQLVRRCVEKYPYLAQLMPDSFEKYAQGGGEEADDFDGTANPTSPTSESSPPSANLRKVQGTG